MDATVRQVIEQTMNGVFEGGLLVGTLENGGVDLAPFHDMDDLVPDALKAELATIRASLIDGSLSASD